MFNMHQGVNIAEKVGCHNCVFTAHQRSNTTHDHLVTATELKKCVASGFPVNVMDT